jgi:hypothetical protein
MKAPANNLGRDGGREMMRGKNTTGDLFPDALPTTGPSLPDPTSRRAAILEALRHGDCLTQANALARGWGWRLAADIFALKEEHGWPIQAAMIPQGEGRNPIALYWLDRGDL